MRRISRQILHDERLCRPTHALVLCLLIFLAAGTCLSSDEPAVTPGPAVAPAPLPGDREAGILQRLARTAVRYREFALKFTCREKMSWSPYEKRGSAEFGYVFEFNEGFGFSDFRTLSNASSRGKAPPEAFPDRMGVPAYLGSPYLWIFTFREERQRRHKYVILGNEQVDGRQAVMIHFEPRPPIDAGVNDWFGTAWVDQETALLLKVEAYTPDNWAELSKLKEHLARDTEQGGFHDVQRITTIFSVEKNGMRFPGKVELRNERHRLIRRAGQWSTWTSVRLQVDQEYTGYAFYGVETNQKVIRTK
ncbi:MAG TPA: hypothetical protein VFE84_13930 [Patescibacteria group bacterium]|nr:hypothetical protein [Patescibacteria group bacterium]